MKRILSLLILVFIGCKPSEMSPERIISGVVTNDSLGPAPFVLVSVKGTSKGVQSDLDGKYSIKVKKGDVLVFFFVGYEKVEFEIGTQPTLNVRLKLAPLLTSMNYSSQGSATGNTENSQRNDPKKMFESDQAQNKLQLYILGGLVPTALPGDKAFEEKYLINYHDFGCVAPTDIGNYIKYNHLVLNYLKNRYGPECIKAVNNKVLGWRDWNKR